MFIEDCNKENCDTVGERDNQCYLCSLLEIIVECRLDSRISRSENLYGLVL